MQQHDKVLIVEDEGLIANDLAIQLRSSGYEVSAIAASGEEALAVIEKSQPDLVLMDIRLKGKLDGIDAALQIRSEYALPVIFLTSHADADTVARAKYAEPFGYLVKPFRQVTLCSAIEIALFKSRCERTLVEREAWLTTVLQSTGDPTIVTNVEGDVQFVNAAAEHLLRCRMADIAGLRLTDAAPLVDAASGRPMDWPASMEKKSTSLPDGTVLRRRHAEDVPVAGEVSPSVFRGSVIGAVITMRDVSQRQLSEAEARHKHKMQAIERMAGKISHDFNNLLAVILGHGSLLEVATSDPTERIHIQAMIAAAQTATEIAKQLLALSGKVVLSSEVLYVNDRVKRVIRMLHPALGPPIHIETNLTPDTGKVRMNSAQFDQVLLNLMLNARDAMPEGGSVTVSTSNVDRVSHDPGGDVIESLVSITVTDTGEGISPEARDHIFEPFFTTKQHAKGSGLGLSIVYGIVTDAGGEIIVRSTPGVGASFTVLLPRVHDQIQLTLDEGAMAIPREALQTTLLLAEDEPALRELLQCYLEQCGYRVLLAEDGIAALELAETYKGRIHLLLSDVLMPNMDGVTLAQMVTMARPDIQVLFMSAYTGASIKPLRNNTFAASFLQKPFALPELLEKVLELTAAETDLSDLRPSLGLHDN